MRAYRLYSPVACAPLVSLGTTSHFFIFSFFRSIVLMFCVGVLIVPALNGYRHKHRVPRLTSKVSVLAAPCRVYVVRHT